MSKLNSWSSTILHSPPYSLSPERKGSDSVLPLLGRRAVNMQLQFFPARSKHCSWEMPFPGIKKEKKTIHCWSLNCFEKKKSGIKQPFPQRHLGWSRMGQHTEVVPQSWWLPSHLVYLTKSHCSSFLVLPWTICTVTPVAVLPAAKQRKSISAAKQCRSLKKSHRKTKIRYCSSF